jgi:hypothetical protein
LDWFETTQGSVTAPGGTGLKVFDAGDGVRALDMHSPRSQERDHSDCLCSTVDSTPVISSSDPGSSTEFLPGLTVKHFVLGFALSLPGFLVQSVAGVLLSQAPFQCS